MTTSIKKKSLPEQSVTVPWVDILQDAEDGLLALSIRVGLQVLQQMMAAVRWNRSHHAERVKHWTNGLQVLHPLACAFFIEDTLTRVPGDRGLPVLHAAVKVAQPGTRRFLGDHYFHNGRSMAHGLVNAEFLTPTSHWLFNRSTRTAAMHTRRPLPRDSRVWGAPQNCDQAASWRFKGTSGTIGWPDPHRSARPREHPPTKCGEA